MAYPRYLRSRDHKFVRRTSVTTATFTTTTAAQIDTTLDITLAARSGDTIECGVSAFWAGSANSEYGALDVATIVSSSIVNYFSNGTGTHAQYGVVAWMSNHTVVTNEPPAGGSFMYDVQSGDLSGGLVTLRLVGYLSAAGSRALTVSAALPLQFWAKNLGPQDPN
jgi:hypothetical protein